MLSADNLHNERKSSLKTSLLVPSKHLSERSVHDGPSTTWLLEIGPTADKNRPLPLREGRLLYDLTWHVQRSQKNWTITGNHFLDTSKQVPRQKGWPYCGDSGMCRPSLARFIKFELMFGQPCPEGSTGKFHLRQRSHHARRRLQ